MLIIPTITDATVITSWVNSRTFRFKDFQAPILFSITFKALNI